MIPEGVGRYFLALYTKYKTIRKLTCQKNLFLDTSNDLVTWLVTWPGYMTGHMIWSHDLVTWLVTWTWGETGPYPGGVHWVQVHPPRWNQGALWQVRIQGGCNWCKFTPIWNQGALGTNIKNSGQNLITSFSFTWIALIRVSTFQITWSKCFS